jgi:hypothetical protein
MTYSRPISECSGNCSGWPSCWLQNRDRAGELEPLEGPLHCLLCWVDVPLRNHDAAVPRDPHDGKSVHSRFTKPCEHCMAQRVEHKISSEDRDTLTVDLGRASIAVEMIQGCAQVRQPIAVREDEGLSASAFRVRGIDAARSVRGTTRRAFLLLPSRKVPQQGPTREAGRCIG